MIRYERVTCADGFSMSVQANFGAYCEPREDNAVAYEEVEVGFPSAVEPLLKKWAESPDRPTDTVYGYVPVDVVRAVIQKHGGIESGQTPPGVL